MDYKIRRAVPAIRQTYILYLPSVAILLVNLPLVAIFEFIAHP